jgi:hypothetical protein
MFIATSLSRNANNLHESAVPRNGHDGKADHEICEAMGDKFPKHIFHSIICIGALVARRDNAHWEVTALGDSSGACSPSLLPPL